MYFFVFPTITGHSDAVDPIWVAPWESWRPGDFKNVGLIGFSSFWTGVTAAQSQQSLKFSTCHRNYGSLRKIVTFELGICALWNAYQLMSTLLTWADKHFKAYSCLVQKLQFFVTNPSPQFFLLIFDPTLKPDNSVIKPSNVEKYHLFGKPWACSSTTLDRS